MLGFVQHFSSHRRWKTKVEILEKLKHVDVEQSLTHFVKEKDKYEFLQEDFDELFHKAMDVDRPEQGHTSTASDIEEEAARQVSHKLGLVG